jgi:DNA-binding response OmpR family regulator
MVKKVLVLDDDDLIRSTLFYFLQQEGYHVEAYAQPDHCPIYLSNQCICQVNEPCADIIITDINMPGTGGIEFIQSQLRKGCKVTHIAVMSGDWESGQMKIARDLGCKTFLKPFSILAMKKWLESLQFETKPTEKRSVVGVAREIDHLKRKKRTRKTSRK